MLKNIIENWKCNSDKMIRKSIFKVRYRLSHDSKNQLLFLILTFQVNNIFKSRV